MLKFCWRRLPMCRHHSEVKMWMLRLLEEKVMQMRVILVLNFMVKKVVIFT